MFHPDAIPGHGRGNRPKYLGGARCLTIQIHSQMDLFQPQTRGPQLTRTPSFGVWVEALELLEGQVPERYEKHCLHAFPLPGRLNLSWPTAV